MLCFYIISYQILYHIIYHISHRIMSCHIVSYHIIYMYMYFKSNTRKLHLQANVTKKVIILRNPSYRLQALRESRPPWLRQIITPIFPNVIMLSLGGERLTPKVLNHYLHHDLGMQQLLCYFYAHLLILEYSDHQQNLISSSLYYPGALRKISSHLFIPF